MNEGLDVSRVENYLNKVEDNGSNHLDFYKHRLIFLAEENILI